MTRAPQLALADATATHLVFTLHGSLYAVDALAVREILWLPEVIWVEAMPPFVVGVIDRRGHLLPVIDLSARLGRPRSRYRPQDSIIILEGATGTVGVIVSEVLNVGRLTTPDQEVGSTVDRSAVPLVAGLAKAGNDIVTLLNPAALWDSEVDGAAVDSAATELAELPRVEPERYFCPQATAAERALFHERALTLMQPVATRDDADLWAVAVVLLDGEYFGIDLHLVREFAPIRQITPVPCCPPHIVGQTNLRGEILTLVDIRAALQIPLADTKSGQQIVVILVENGCIGILVDAVLDIIHLQPADMQAVPTAVRSLLDDCLTATAPYAGRLAGILDLARILTRPEMVVFEEV